MPSSRGSSRYRDRTHVFCSSSTAGYHWATREALSNMILQQNLSSMRAGVFIFLFTTVSPNPEWYLAHGKCSIHISWKWILEMFVSWVSLRFGVLGLNSIKFLAHGTLHQYHFLLFFLPTYSWYCNYWLGLLQLLFRVATQIFHY